jgi:hypothetical protein
MTCSGFVHVGVIPRTPDAQLEGNFMPEKQPTLQEFEFRPTALIHVPTGATWTILAGTTEPGSVLI